MSNTVRVCAVMMAVGVVIGGSGCGMAYTVRNLEGGGGLVVDSVGIVGISLGDLMGESYSTTSNISLGHEFLVNLGWSGFDTGDIFVDEVKYLLRIFQTQTKVRPYVGLGCLFGIYMEDNGTAEGETDVALGLSVAAGLHARLAEGFALGVEYSQNFLTVPEYGGGDLTVSLVFKAK